MALAAALFYSSHGKRLPQISGDSEMASVQGPQTIGPGFREDVELELGLLWDQTMKVLVASGRSEQEGRRRQETSRGHAEAAGAEREPG